MKKKKKFYASDSGTHWVHSTDWPQKLKSLSFFCSPAFQEDKETILYEIACVVCCCCCCRVIILRYCKILTRTIFALLPGKFFSAFLVFGPLLLYSFMYENVCLPSSMNSELKSERDRDKKENSLKRFLSLSKRTKMWNYCISYTL